VSSKNAFWSIITLPVIGAIVLVLVLFLVWCRFKHIALSVYLKQNPSWSAMNEEPNAFL
jgi:hypothetical protein